MIEQQREGNMETNSFNPERAFRLDGEVAIVTGGAKGIGRAIAKCFARVGARVVILDFDREASLATAESIVQAGGAAEAIALDVTSEKEVDEAFASVFAKHGRVDVLVNSAGKAIRRPTVELPLELWNEVMETNVTGMFLCCRAAARIMLKQRSGRIVNMASIMGFSGGGVYPNISYQTSKGAVVNMTRALAVEWARCGIRVNAIAPTWVRTDFIKAMLQSPEVVAEIERITPMGRMAEPEEMAGAALFLATHASDMVTGHILAVDGGYLAQ
jgi:NAD(P)-dependent dehydrogenase (short-subunit alcohol dehydrogenase family)